MMRLRSRKPILAGMVALAAVAGVAGASGVPPQVSQLRVRVDGLTCPFCAYGIEKRVKRLETVASYYIEIRQGEVTLVGKPGHAISPEKVRQAVADAGFTPRSMSLTATGTLALRNGRMIFTLATVEPAVRYVVSATSMAQGIEGAAKAGATVRVTGRLRPTGNKPTTYDVAIDQLELAED